MKSPIRSFARLLAFATLAAGFPAFLHAAPSISSITTNPAAPSSADTVTVTANVLPSAGATLSQVQLTYNLGAVTTKTVFQENFGNAATTAGFSGAVDLMNTWTATTTGNAGSVKLVGGTNNHTAPIVLTNCSTSTVNGTTTVTCASNSGLAVGMSFSGSINGTSIAAATTIASIPASSTTTFVLSTAVSVDGTVANATAAGVSLTGCSLATTPTVNCASTTGLSAGMGITSTSGTGLTTNPANPTVLAVTNGTQFTLSSTVTAVPATLTASGVGLVLNTGDTTLTHTMAAITNPINAASATTGTIQFYAQTQNFVSNNGWTFQVSPDGGTTWNTRFSETYAAETVTVTGCTLNATATVSCTSVAGLSAGMAVQSANLTITSCTTSSTTNPTVVTTTDATDLANLAVGMYVIGTGIPGNTRVIAVGGANGANTFTMSGSASASGTVTVTANYLPANAVINTINTTANTFTLSGGTVFANVSGLTLFATAINHGFVLEQYTLAASELTANLMFRFQFSGYTPVAPIKPPTLDIDDITVTLVNGVPPVTVAMTSTGNGSYTGQIPAEVTGTTVSYTVSATDSLSSSTSVSGSPYTVTASAPVLSVTPVTPLTTSGPVGGPFTPSGANYTVSNTGVGSMSWTASNTTNWLTLSQTSGTLAAGASTIVTATINSAANSLSGGGYADTLTFTNTTTGTGNTTRAVSLTALAPPVAPTLTALPTWLNGNYNGLTWPAVTGATTYLVQISSSANFTTPLLSETVSSTRVSFSSLADGTTYYYRVAAVNSVGTSPWSATVSSVQDATPPLISITSPTSGTSTAATTITVTGTASDATSGIASVRVNNSVAATTTNGYATWTATVPIGFGTTVVTATAVDGAGNPTTAAAVLVTGTTQQTYNPLYIPDELRGPTFNLTLDQNTKQYFAGPTTQTYSYNHAGFWGPTLLMRKGDFIQVNLTNNLPATTTTHWHGFHIPAIMDGGPHEVIPAGTVWSPSFYMKNQAATYWYHPHLHPNTQQQLTMGAGGLIIVQDDQEAALTLPRTYGVDDFPIVLTSRSFLNAGIGTNQFVTQGAFGDNMLVNGTLKPQVSLPAQIVRLRILDAEIARNHNLGFSDNRTFYVIGTDGGLLNEPVPVTRMVMGSAERYEILLDLRGATPGTSVDLMTYNAGQWTGYSGGQPGTTGANGSLLNNINFVDLHINIVAPTANPVTTIPTTLANNVYWTSADVTNSRTVNLTGVGGAPLGFDNLVYSPSVINQTVNYNAVEQWTLANVSNLDHTFHIHDIQFYLTSYPLGYLSSNPGGIPAYMQGWKDTFILPTGTNVSFIAKFDDFASNTNPFMFHCHFLQHEDGGLMGQFLVQNNAVEDLAISSFTRVGSNPNITLQFQATPGTTYSVQYSPDMTTSSWTEVGSITSDGTSGTFVETNSARLGLARGFYRVAIPAITQ